MLTLLPDLTFPIRQKQADPLMVNLVQLNLMEGSLNEKQQRGLALYFHTFDLWVKSHGAIDYRGKDGHTRLVQDAMTLVGPGNPVATRFGDLQAAHLAIDWHDCQMRLKAVGATPLSADVSILLEASRDLSEFPIEMEKRTALLMDYLGKRRLV